VLAEKLYWKPKREIRCVTFVDDELFALINRSTDIEVYRETYSLWGIRMQYPTIECKRKLCVPGLTWGCLWGTDAEMTACQLTKLIFILGHRKTGTIHRMDRFGDDYCTWKVCEYVNSITTTRNGLVVVLCGKVMKLKEFLSCGTLLLEVNLHHSALFDPVYAIKVSPKRYLLSDRGSFRDDSRQICEVNHRGYVMHSFYGKELVTQTDHKFVIRFHRHLPMGFTVDKQGFVYVADFASGRVVLLSPTLKYFRDVGNKLFCAPYNIHLNTTNGRLLVEDRDFNRGDVLVAVILKPITSVGLHDTCRHNV
jgi:hypothetical protein